MDNLYIVEVKTIRSKRDRLMSELYLAQVVNNIQDEMLDIFRQSWSYRIKNFIADYLEML